MSWTCDVPGSCGFWRHQIDLVLGSRLWALNKQNGCTMQAERWGVQLKYGIRPSPGGVLPNGADDRQGELRCCQTSYTHRHKNQGESPTGTPTTTNEAQGSTCQNPSHQHSSSANIHCFPRYMGDLLTNAYCAMHSKCIFASQKVIGIGKVSFWGPEWAGVGCVWYPVPSCWL